MHLWLSLPRFLWVQVWLEIMLPLRDFGNTTWLVQDAQKKLEAMRRDSIHSRDNCQRLEAGYQRLWDLNTRSGYEIRQTRLFQFALGSFEPFGIVMLTEVLRIQEDSYTKQVSTRDVELLFANFLRPTPSQGLQFVHGAALNFILDLKLNKAPGKSSAEWGFSKEQNHMSIARLFVEIMSRSSHPFWRHLGIDPSNWRDVFLDPEKMQWLEKDLRRWQRGNLGSPLPVQTTLQSYLSKWGLRHCSFAAKERSLFDELWSVVLDNVVLAPDSAFGFAILAEGSCADLVPGHSWNSTSCTSILGIYNGRLELLCSQVLARFGLIDSADVSRLHFGGAVTGVRSDNDRQRRLFEHVACRAGIKYPEDSRQPVADGLLYLPPDGRTALHIAIERRNKAAVDIFL